ncbi:LysR substrate-binding domain-containing protein [Cobetia sp. 10Alg 146]|uniref:LysR family transcriptional regulator n=1 Tax=Cobetia sp. 10Alg 146 TaxID=3040019 RepID=UPI00244CBA7B|nr:LysR substrate-binding domain-containing protein [Cobetia sp. 10Alg 146]MDH2290748.1 LysR substrate-binding domain-containing protein [Cobetia sp. 10Alg 146]
MRLRDLEVFHAVLQAGSVTGAARLLHVSQPAASKALQQVERQWGIALFTRSAGQLVPTEEARKLEAASQGMLGQLDDVKRLVEGLRSGEAQSLKVVATPAIAQQLLPQALGQWRRRHARVNCELATQHTREIIDALLLHEVDIAFTLSAPTHPALMTRALARMPLKVLAPAGHWAQECQQAPMTVAELAGQRLIALGAHDPLARRLDGLLASEMPSPSESGNSKAPSSPRIVTRVQTYPLAAALVQAGEGLAVVDALTAHTACRERGLDARTLPQAGELMLSAVWRREAGRGRLAQSLADQLATLAAQWLQGCALDDGA